MDQNLRSKLIRLAHARPELRAEILPLLAQTKQAKLLSRHEAILKKFVDGGGKAQFYDELPPAITKALDAVKYLETMESDVDRWLNDHNLRRRGASQVRKAHGAVALKNPQVMLYVIDPADNKSKFYEMQVVSLGQESSSMKTKDFARGMGNAVLMKRWGRLTDRGGVTGRVDSMNEIYANEQAAVAAMMAWKREKMQRSGYKDVSGTKTYPIGLGSAGFGWGGQVACNYVPELKQMSGVVNKSKNDLAGMVSTLAALERRNSGMAQAIASLYSEAMSSLGKLDTYLEGQLASC